VAGLGRAEGVRLHSVERDPDRAAVATALFAGHPEVEIHHADWHHLEIHAPYDLLVLDGGGQGKTPDDSPADPTHLLAPGDTVIIDDFTPSTTWPPLHDGSPDHARLHWLDHPALHTTELRLAEDLSTLVGTRLRHG